MISPTSLSRHCKRLLVLDCVAIIVWIIITVWQRENEIMGVLVAMILLMAVQTSPFFSLLFILTKSFPLDQHTIGRVFASNILYLFHVVVPCAWSAWEFGKIR